jgi:SiaC family regulatory phosphoprotein
LLPRRGEASGTAQTRTAITMANLKLEGSPKTPTVSFDEQTGLLELKGRSIPENSIDFYKPLIDWVDRYSKTPQPKTAMHVQLEYFNTSSSKCILDLFKKLEMVRQTGNEVTVFWHYEADDEDMLEAGEDYQAIINIPFKMIQIAEVDGGAS